MHNYRIVKAAPHQDSFICTKLGKVFPGRKIRLDKSAVLIIGDSVQNHFFTSAFRYHRNNDCKAEGERVQFHAINGADLFLHRTN